MSGRNVLRERAALLDELGQIMQAMKNLAFAELQRVTRVLPALTLARDTLLDALRASHDGAGRKSNGRRRAITWLVIGAERGFCGPFNARLAAAVEDLRRENPDACIAVASRRLADLIGGDAAIDLRLSGCAAIEDIEAVLDEWTSALIAEAEQGREAWLLHADAEAFARRRLLPEPELDHGSDVPRSSVIVPMHYLPLASLRAALLRQAVRLLLRGGLLASLEQENRWRLAQMQRAVDHLDELGRRLRRRAAILRQAEITNELETLMSSLDGISRERAVGA